MSTLAPTLTANGVSFEATPETCAETRSSNELLGDPSALRARMAEDGYLLFRDLIDRETILEARREILLKYAVVGEIDSIRHPLMDAVRSESSAIDKVNLRAFTESVRTGLAYERVVLHARLLALMEQLLEGEVRPFDFRWPRFVRPGEGCGFHYDGPYMSRGTPKIFTAWIPLGDVSREEGALILLENSHRHETLLNTYAKRDADKENISWLGTDPVKLQRSLSGRWLWTDFRAGDVMCFGMHMLHGALDNLSPTGRCRLSSDTRYQLASEPYDERWNGPRATAAHGDDKVFLPGLGSWNNKDFQDEWKRVDENGRLILPD